MFQVPELKPVRDYSNIRKDALSLFFREASGANEGINQRAQEFRQHAVRVLGPDAFKKDRKELLEELKDEARSWGLSFHTNPDKVIEFAAENPVAMKLPLSRLLNVPASHNTVTGLLADAIDSIVTLVVLNSTEKEIEQAAQRAAAVGGQDAAPFHALTPVEFGLMKKWPFEGLNAQTFHYLDKAIDGWAAKTAPYLHRLLPDELQNFMVRNSPKTQGLKSEEKLGLLKKSTLLSLSKIDPLLKKMNVARNNVGDVVSAALDTAIYENAMKWFEEVGRSIDWKDRFRGENGFEGGPGASQRPEDDLLTEQTPSSQSVPDDTGGVGTKVERPQRDKVKTRVQ